jgi:predicted transcriptional regulator
MEKTMSRTITLRLDDGIYQKFKSLAIDDNRPLSNFIQTAALRFVEEHERVDEFEMAEIRGNTDLNRSIQNGLQDAKSKQGQFV